MRGLQRRVPHVDLVRAVDVGLADAPDRELLVWAALEGRFLLTFDRKTMPKFMYELAASGVGVPGVFVIRGYASPRAVRDDLELILVASEPDEWAAKITYLPL